MSANLSVLKDQGGELDGRVRESTGALALAGTEPIKDIIREATFPVAEMLAEVRDIMKGCDAEIEIDEEFSVVIEPNRAVFNVKRTTRFAKDRG